MNGVIPIPWIGNHRPERPVSFEVTNRPRIGGAFPSGRFVNAPERLFSIVVAADSAAPLHKRQFNFTKVRFRGLYKNGQALTTKFALANLYTVRRTLLGSAG